MDDKALLEAAARAVGPEHVWQAGSIFVCWSGEPHMSTLKTWQPLVDDGDALRLAVKLHIEIQSYAESGKVYAHSKELLGYGTDGMPSYQCHAYMIEQFGDDPCAATRRAIVRAAAALGSRGGDRGDA